MSRGGVTRDEGPTMAETEELMAYYKMDSLHEDKWVDAQRGEGVEDTSSNHGPVPQADFDGEDPDADPLGILRNIYQGSLGQTSGNRRSQVLSPSEQRTSFRITAKTFDPKLFLRRVHQASSFDDLARGADHLRVTLQARSEGLRDLVRSNFDQFVGAKNSMDIIHAAMEGQGIVEDTDFGTDDLRGNLEDIGVSADDTFSSILHRRRHAERLRGTLLSLDRHRFLFGLPGSLAHLAAQGKFSAVALNYRKGKQVMRKLRLAAEATAGSLAEGEYRVFLRLWRSVERVISSTRQRLYAQLAQAWRPAESQEKLIGCLVDLGGGRARDDVEGPSAGLGSPPSSGRDLLSGEEINEDPAWFYLQSQARYVEGLLTDAFREYARRMAELRACDTEGYASGASGYLGILRRAPQVRRILQQTGSKEFRRLYGKEVDVRIWELDMAIIGSLSTILARRLPGYWRLSLQYVEDRFSRQAGDDATVGASPSGPPGKPSGLSEEERHYRLQACSRLMYGFMRSYMDKVRSVFGLPIPPRKSDEGDVIGDGLSPPEFSEAPGIPVGSSVGANARYLPRLVSRISECRLAIITKMAAFDRGGRRAGRYQEEVDRRLSRLEREARKQAIVILCDRWLEDAKVFHVHEDWLAEGSPLPLGPDGREREKDAAPGLVGLVHLIGRGGKGGTTGYVKLFYNLQRMGAEACGRLLGPAHAMGAEPTAAEDLRSQSALERVRHTLVWTSLAWLDTLHFLGTTPLIGGDGEGDKGAEVAVALAKLDMSVPDFRLLSVSSTLHHFLDRALPAILRHVARDLLLEMDHQGVMVRETATLLQDTLLDVYLSRRAPAINDPLHEGILYSGLDWAGLKQPMDQGPRPFLYRTLLNIVLVHAEMTEVAPILTNMALLKLHNGAAQVWMEDINQIDRLGKGGILQILLELTYFERVLQHHASPLTLTYYRQARSAIDRAAIAGGAYDAYKGKELDRTVGELVDKGLAGSSVQFLCFGKIK